MRLPPATLLVVMVSGTRASAQALRETVKDVLASMGLKLSDAKTQVVHIDEGFDFLGFHIHRKRKRGSSKRYVYTHPSKKALMAIKAKVRTLTRRSLFPTLSVLLHRLNPALRGSAAYFQHGVSKRTFSYLGEFTWQRVVSWLRKQYPARDGSSYVAATSPGGGRRRTGSNCSAPQR